jgi:hypothetical protein
MTCDQPLKVCLALVLLSCAGCGDKGPFQYMPVQGKLTYEDGSPIPAVGIMLQFESLDAKPVGEMHPRPAMASVDSNGVFTCATSLKYADGLIPGRHKVALHYATDAKGKLLVPKPYTHLGTTAGNMEIKVPKP